MRILPLCSLAVLALVAAACAAPTTTPDPTSEAVTTAPAPATAPAAAAKAPAGTPSRSAVNSADRALRVPSLMSFSKRAPRAPLGPQRTRANACNVLDDPTVSGDLVAADGAPPLATGGDVPDGTYLFTGGNYYGSGAPAGTVLASVAVTVVIAAGSYDSASAEGGRVDGSSGTISFDGISSATIAESCPGAPEGAISYASDGTTLTLIGPDFDEEYTLQP